MPDIQSTVGELVNKLHTNIDHINQIIQSLSNESYNRKLEQLSTQRESAIHSLRERRADALKQILAQRAREKEETSKKRALERKLIEEQRIKEWEEILVRRKIEDEKWLRAIEAEDQESEKSRSYEDEEREREREEEERILFEKSENEIETLENEMERSLEEGRITLKKLDEDRKIINAQIEAALSAPTVIPNLSFKSRRQKRREKSYDQYEQTRHESNCEIPDKSLSITSMESSEVENSSFCTEVTDFEKSISDGKSSTRSSTSSCTEPKELRLVSLMQKEMSEEAIRKRESVFFQKTNSTKSSSSSVDLTKRLSTWRMTSEAAPNDIELSRVFPTQEALASEEHMINLLSVFPIKYVHNKTNSRIARSKSIDEKSKISNSFNLKKKITKKSSPSGTFVGQTSHDNNDECQISPSDDGSEISDAKDSGIKLNKSYCEISQIDVTPIVPQKMLEDSTDIPTKQDNQIEKHDLCIAGISELENINQKLQRTNESKPGSPIENDFKSSKKSPIEFPAYPDESVKEAKSISDGLLSRDIVNSLELTSEMFHKIKCSSKPDSPQENKDNISALKLVPELIAIEDSPRPILDTTSPEEGQIEQLSLVSRFDNRVKDAISHSYPENFVLNGSDTTTSTKSEISSTNDGDGSSSTNNEVLNSIFPDFYEYKVEKTGEIIAECMNNYSPKSPQLSEQILSINNASLSNSNSKSEIEINLRNEISGSSTLIEINEQDSVSETLSQISQSLKQEIIHSDVERTVTNEIGTSYNREFLDPNEVREVDFYEPQSHQVLAKFSNPENFMEFESIKKRPYSDFTDEDSTLTSERIISAQHMSPKNVDVLEEINNVPAISSGDHSSIDSIGENELYQIEKNCDSLITTFKQENEQIASIDVQISIDSCTSGSNAIISSTLAQDFNNLITQETTDLTGENESMICQEAELNSPQIYNQKEISKFVMLPSNMRYKRSISRDIAALKYVNKGHKMQLNYLSNSQPSTALTSFNDIITEANTTKYKKKGSEIFSDEHINNCQVDLSIEENPKLEKSDTEDDLKNCSVINQEQDKELINGRVEPQKKSCNNQQNISLISDVNDLSNHISSERRSPCESPSYGCILPKKHDQISTTSSPLVSEFESPRPGEASSDGIADPENTQKNKENYETTILNNKSNEDVPTQGFGHGDLYARRYSKISDVSSNSEAENSKNETPRKSQFTNIYNHKDIANIDGSKVSELNDELRSSNLEAKEVEQEHLPTQLSIIDSISDSMLPTENILYSPIFDSKKLTRRLSYDSIIGKEKSKEFGMEHITKERKFIHTKVEQNNVPLLRTLSENDLTKLMKKCLDKDIINSHRISSIGSNATAAKEEIISNTMNESSSAFEHSISTSPSEEPFSSRLEISTTENIASSRKGFSKEYLREDDKEVRNLTRLTDSEDELCNSHLRTDSNTSHDPRNSLVDQANNEYQHEFSIQPSILSLQNSEALTPMDAIESDQATSVSTASFFQKARALFDNQQQQPRLDNRKTLTKRVRPLSGLLNLRGGILSSRQRFDNNFLAISEDEDTNNNVPSSSNKNSVGINRSYTSMSHAESSKLHRRTTNHRTEQSRLSFYESLQRAATASTSPIHSPVF